MRCSGCPAVPPVVRGWLLRSFPLGGRSCPGRVFPDARGRGGQPAARGRFAGIFPDAWGAVRWSGWAGGRVSLRRRGPIPSVRPVGRTRAWARCVRCGGGSRSRLSAGGSCGRSRWVTGPVPAGLPCRAGVARPGGRWVSPRCWGTIRLVRPGADLGASPVQAVRRRAAVGRSGCLGAPLVVRGGCSGCSRCAGSRPGGSPLTGGSLVWTGVGADLHEPGPVAGRSRSRGGPSRPRGSSPARGSVLDSPEARTRRGSGRAGS